MDNNDITSNNFDYDIYTGGSAEEIMKELDAQQKAEAEAAEKEAAEKKKEAYRRKFEGMSADELFSDPVKPIRPMSEDTMPMPEDFGAPDIEEAESVRPAPSGDVPGYGHRKPMPDEFTAREMFAAGHSEEEADEFFEIYHRLRMKEEYRERRYNYRRTGRYRTDEELKGDYLRMTQLFIGGLIGFAAARLFGATPDCYPLMAGIGTLISSLVVHTGIEDLSVSEAMSKSFIEIGLIIFGIVVLIVY